MATLTDTPTTDPATGRTIIITVCATCGERQEWEWSQYNLGHATDCPFHTDNLSRR